MHSVPHHIIAIGASAGGMEEINEFFDHTPMDGVSYVIIQHLSPVFKSRMVELLAKHSKLLVKEAEDDMLVLTNEVYLIPHDKFMTIVNGRFILTEKEQVKGPHLTINTFFTSLAIDCGEKAICVILSGLGSDGTEGAQRIKAEGGMVIARDPRNAEFGSMPASVISAGAADLILEPSQMPRAIEQYLAQYEAVFISSSTDEKDLKDILELIKEQLPLDFSGYKRPRILRRIKRRASEKKVSNLEDYVALLKNDPEEVKALAQDFLISVTSFFRDKESFEFLQLNCVPKILAKLQDGEELKMWVAGCATGEEAYSFAIIIHELLKDGHKDVVVKIFATDIDNNALAVAGKGLYSSAVVKDISAERLDKYFTKEGNQYRVKHEIRKMLIFAQHDLVKNPPYCNMNMISCRNLLIYMSVDLQKKIYLMLLFGLKTDGYLFLGSSENPGTIAQHLETVNKKFKIFKSLQTKRSVYFDGFALPQMADVREAQRAAAKPESNQHIFNSLTEAVNKTLIADLDYLAVCIDENNTVLRTYGDTTRFLLQKNFTSNIVELLPIPLMAVFNTSIISARKNNERVIVNGVPLKENGGKRIDLSVYPLNIQHGSSRIFLVVFNHSADEATLQTIAAPYDEKKHFDEYINILEDELNNLKDRLHNTYAQLDASNDNMQSYNEELLSANEEMQSTNEEMQSVNEELQTINTEYQLKNKELLELNDDLNNYFRSNIHGQLFVNNDMLLMKFSPGTVNLINLLPTDIGRPLSNISTNIKFETLIDDIKLVLSKGTIITKEIQTNNGSWYQVVTMPYIQQIGNKKDGAILTFNDITALKTMQDELSKKNKSLIRINGDLDNFVHTASHDLLAPLSNIELSINVMNKLNDVDPALNNFLAIINNSVKKFRSLITEISTIAKIDSDMLPAEMVDIEELIQDVEWSLNDKITGCNAVLNCHLDITRILFSKKSLRSILFNLISNGIKFNEKSPVIDITTTKTDEGFLLTVSDNGIGMKEEDVENIFGMYKRLNPTLEGQGVGLYLVKKIVDAAEATIHVKTEIGKGSTFSIYFDSSVETNGLMAIS
ncbi:chemotaxis protein CheB [Ferruginibacter sp. HRS2-29]|uniref:chemotaxis protein CheB n=1 Tax=Ferruginibacter sp. HRS2-29 TaxID=2487334 RepID=UPI0020CC59C6|nr:chemotaxis protein CheB [Ferruginibacter sp. HRS2-29]MCP9749746.1 chemotaxis protein CheR [Ferruginibacter sp. HRS2-29]